jgi:hypothetical protein
MAIDDARPCPCPLSEKAVSYSIKFEMREHPWQAGVLITMTARPS